MPGAGEQGGAEHRGGEAEPAQHAGRAAGHLLPEDAKAGEYRRRIGEQGGHSGRGQDGAPLEGERGRAPTPGLMTRLTFSGS